MMSSLVDVQALGLVAFGDDFGGPVTAGPDVADDAWWPWVLVVFAAAVVVLGAILFTPDADSGRAQCQVATCPPPPVSEPAG